ncbi:MAG TPA: ankyrin repeat domain-containing protein [Gemmataceae bacterium]|jgi:hypothetical protein
MANRKADALLQAATFGKVDEIRKLLAGGAPIEATNANRWTPVMSAAAQGHIEAFHVLVEAGADLHARGFRQTDLLELAVDGGNVEIVRLLLERGLPVNGHWQLPDSDNPAFRKIGHDTPLIRAAEAGNVEIVRMLLEAGADRDRKHDGQTALGMAKERLRDPDYEEDRQAYREIVALLGCAPARSGRSLDSIKDEIARFAEHADRPEYAKLHDSLVTKCGPGHPWNPVADHGLPATHVVAFTLKKVKSQKALEALRQKARHADFQLVLGEQWLPGEDAELVLFPTADKLAVVAAVGTEGTNYGVKNFPHVIDWLDALDAESPFSLFLCNHEAVGGTFDGPVKAVKKLAEQIVKFCPSSLDEGVDDAQMLALVLKKAKSFVLRWD